MTAKEIKEKRFVPTCHDENGNIMGYYAFDTEEMQEFIEQLCKEQRYEILESVNNSMAFEEVPEEWKDIILEHIINQEMPEL